MFGIIVLNRFVSAKTHNLALRKPDVTSSEFPFADVQNVLCLFLDVTKTKIPTSSLKNASRTRLFNQDKVGMNSFFAGSNLCVYTIHGLS